ncbi:Inward rectifier potassium channel 2 [Aphelenchoides besseyi]|nr:Inward rectifier potassium channel 2 [Aphelenchoides besseyi]KAI6209918.1 Inward rectifier potassium channel 2 [Aphelenchoides besseyi]
MNHVHAAPQQTSRDTTSSFHLPHQQFLQHHNHHSGMNRRLTNNNSDHSDLPLLDADASDDICCSASEELHDPRGTNMTNTTATDEMLTSNASSLNTAITVDMEQRSLAPKAMDCRPHLNIASPATTLTDLSSQSLLANNHMHNNGMLSAQSLPTSRDGKDSNGKAAARKFGRRPSLGLIESQKLPPEVHRLVAKNGECLVRPRRLQTHLLHVWIRNWFHLLIEISWRCMIAVFAACFVISWIAFGLVYYAIVVFSGDLQKEPEYRQCIANVHGFISAFLFSLESQQTIGYGSRYMTDMCPPAFITLSLQLIVGLLLQTMLAGVVVAKVLRPKKRKQELRFSRCAVIGPLDENDQRPALMIRIADIQHRLYLAESHVRLYMVRTKINANGRKEVVGFRDICVGYDQGWDRVLLLWPITIRHIIDEDSPLYHMTPDEMRGDDFELIMTVEGIVEATGATFQARTSFLPTEIQWGRRFTPMVHLNEKTDSYEVDYGLFDITDHCPEFIPRVVAEIKNEIEEEAQNGDEDDRTPHFHAKSGFT